MSKRSVKKYLENPELLAIDYNHILVMSGMSAEEADRKTEEFRRDNNIDWEHDPHMEKLRKAYEERQREKNLSDKPRPEKS